MCCSYHCFSGFCLFAFFSQTDYSNYQTPKQQIPVTPSTLGTSTPTLLYQVVEELQERAEEINRQQRGNLSISVRCEDVSDDDIIDVSESRRWQKELWRWTLITCNLSLRLTKILRKKNQQHGQCSAKDQWEGYLCFEHLVNWIPSFDFWGYIVNSTAHRISVWVCSTCLISPWCCETYIYFRSS